VQAQLDGQQPDGPFEGYIVSDLDGKFFFNSKDDIAIVHVKGSGPKKQEDEWFKNPFGHTLLWLGPGVGFVHSCEPGFNRCRYLPSEEWNRYCNEMGKPTNPEQVITVGHLITDEHFMDFIDKVNEMLTVGFKWVPWHDCSTMVDEVLEAGGVPKSYQSENPLPAISVLWNTIKSKVTGFIVHDNFPNGGP
jgi:hypothetical protein